MVIAAPEPPAKIQPKGEQRVVFRGITWENYLHILDQLPQSRGSRLIYDDGVLEITMPLEDHQRSFLNRRPHYVVETQGMDSKQNRKS